jgi:hypothetical protein
MSGTLTIHEDPLPHERQQLHNEGIAEMAAALAAIDAFEAGFLKTVDSGSMQMHEHWMTFGWTISRLVARIVANLDDDEAATEMAGTLFANAAKHFPAYLRDRRREQVREAEEAARQAAVAAVDDMSRAIDGAAIETPPEVIPPPPPSPATSPAAIGPEGAPTPRPGAEAEIADAHETQAKAMKVFYYGFIKLSRTGAYSMPELVLHQGLQIGTLVAEILGFAKTEKRLMDLAAPLLDVARDTVPMAWRRAQVDRDVAAAARASGGGP